VDIGENNRSCRVSSQLALQKADNRLQRADKRDLERLLEPDGIEGSLALMTAAVCHYTKP
jgi:hypothetical protein